MFIAIIYVLRTGIQWKALPHSSGASSTVHDRFQQWERTGVFRKLWGNGILQLYIEGTLDWSFQSIDGAMTKAPLGKEATGAIPTDRGKKGIKRHLFTVAGGLPVSLSVTSANVHDSKEVQTVLLSMPFLPSFPCYEESVGGKKAIL